MGVYIWLVLMIAFLVVEAACPFHLVSIWFAVGSLVAAVAAWFGAAVWLQITLFAVISCGLLAALWPFVKKVINPKIEKTNVDSIIGSQGYVTQQIDNLTATGQVKLGGMEWTARSVSGKVIPKGALIQVEKVEGVKVFVTAVEATVKEEVSL